MEHTGNHVEFDSVSLRFLGINAPVIFIDDIFPISNGHDRYTKVLAIIDLQFDSAFAETRVPV